MKVSLKNKTLAWTMHAVKKVHLDAVLDHLQRANLTRFNHFIKIYGTLLHAKEKIQISYCSLLILPDEVLISSSIKLHLLVNKRGTDPSLVMA